MAPKHSLGRTVVRRLPQGEEHELGRRLSGARANPPAWSHTAAHRNQRHRLGRGLDPYPGCGGRRAQHQKQVVEQLQRSAAKARLYEADGQMRSGPAPTIEADARRSIISASLAFSTPAIRNRVRSAFEISARKSMTLAKICSSTFLIAPRNVHWL
jgi:hypothetical protein